MAGGIIDTIKLRLRRGDVLLWLILINTAVFIVTALLGLIATLFMVPVLDVTEYIAMPDRIGQLLVRPWTIITYMFAHGGLWHIALNMLMLYWFGRIFFSYFNPKNLGSLYILGGIAGALLYFVAFNTIPFYVKMSPSILIGASASVMAIIFAAAFYRPDAKVQIILIGPVKIIYIALVLFAIDFISLGDPENPGGHIAHIGGALLGYLYARQYLKGRDITRWMSRVIDWFSNLSKPRQKKPKMKVKYNNSRQADYEYNKRKNDEAHEIDAILDKIKKSGYSSLSEKEKKRLFDAGNK